MKNIKVWYDCTEDNPGWVAHDAASEITQRDDIPLDATDPRDASAAAAEAAAYFDVDIEDVTVLD